MTAQSEVIWPHTATTTTIVLVGEPQLVAQGLVAALGAAPDIVVVGVAHDVREALALFEREQPDVAVLSRRVIQWEGPAAVRRLRAAFPDVQLALLTPDPVQNPLRAVLSTACRGYATEDASVGELAELLRVVARGGTMTVGTPPPAGDREATGAHDQGPALTQREQEVLEALSTGMTPVAIARALSLSEHTVRNHIRHLLAKLDAHSRLEAVIAAARLGLIDLRDPGVRDQMP